MILDDITRGSVVEWTVTFLDADGNAVEPESAELKVNFLNSDDERETVEIDMASTTAGWFAEWDSGDALEARVYWSVKSTNPASAKDGVFALKANLANLGAAE